MTDSPPEPMMPDPLEAALSGADDRLLLNHWMPPQVGTAPRVRIGARWINVLWGIPIGTIALVVLIAIAQSLRELPGVMAFIKQYPGIAQDAPSIDTGFPWWLQLQHFVNMFFMLFIIRAGVQILADHPRLYWKRDCTPGTDWFRFQAPRNVSTTLIQPGSEFKLGSWASIERLSSGQDVWCFVLALAA